MGPLKTNLSQAFAGQRVGVKQVEEKIWLVSFMQYDLGPNRLVAGARFELYSAHSIRVPAVPASVVATR
jgi:hypothetical protein